MKNNTVFNGNIFIIPNDAFKSTEHSYDKLCERWNKNMTHQVQPGEELIQIWACTPGSENSNWAAHNDYPGCEHRDCNDPLQRETRFPSYFPKSLFDGKKEGDTIEVEFLGNTYVLTLNQRGYRYRSFGNFEDVLKMVL